ncbi:MAG TPA: SDR family NAD(P)-dependent oxidoreductase [Candidatus Sulfotelmatobacter sp.]|jgi:short-subunit dehydrogenase|nr:SDR family NAD(P)-dependent oxidoreductase [Candidatus Sulfotelmatobacter sp.]
MNPSAILITGASSGLGEALAHAYAAPGVRLFLSGRNAQRLETVAGICRAKGAETESVLVDVADRQAMAGWIAGCERRAPLDLVIANAGIAGGDPSLNDADAEGRIRAIFSVDLDGVINTVLPAVAPMRRRGEGQIVLMSSLAGMRGFPSAPAYCAAKAAVRVWGQGLRGQLAKDGIGVTVVCPGFVKSRITGRNRFPMPMLMETETAARLIVKGIAANKGLISFPWPLAWIMAVFTALPPALSDLITLRLPTKE